MGGPEGQGPYLNLVVELSTSDTPRRLLERCRALEAAAGRVRTVRWGPRTLDADVLWVEGWQVDEEDLDRPAPPPVGAALRGPAPGRPGPRPRDIGAAQARWWGGRPLWVVCSRRYLRSSVGERHPQGAGTPKEVRCTPSGSSVPVGPARPSPLHCLRAAGRSPVSSGATTSWRAPPKVSTCSSSPPPTTPWPRSPRPSCRRRAPRVAHLSGSLGLDALAPHPLRATVHPLVPLPNGEVGAARLRLGRDLCRGRRRRWAGTS